MVSRNVPGNKNSGMQIFVRIAEFSSLEEKHTVLVADENNSEQKRTVIGMDTLLVDFYNSGFLHGAAKAHENKLHLPDGTLIAFHKTPREERDVFPITCVGENHFEIAVAQQEAVSLRFESDWGAAAKVYVGQCNSLAQSTLLLTTAIVLGQQWLDGFVAPRKHHLRALSLEICVYPTIRQDVVFGDAENLHLTPRQLG